MMTKTTEPGKRIELLLNTLRGERYARRSLLAELLDELNAVGEYDDAAKAARLFLERVDALNGDREVEYERELSRLADLTTGPATRRSAAA